MYTKFVSKKIQETLNAKERVLSRKTNGNFTDNPSANSYKTLKDISSRTPFVRMISNKNPKVEYKGHEGNIIISGGERDNDGNMKHGFQKSGEGIYYNTKFNGESRSGIRPIAGIKDVEISYKGGYKAIRQATINWTVGSLEDLERLTPYFLTVGKTVMIDWGWVNDNKSIEQQFGSTYYKDGRVSSQLFTNSQGKILNIGGNYGAMGGVISNFEYQLRQDGGFDCVTKLVAMGANLFKKPVDKGVTARSLTSVNDDENNSDVGLTPIDHLMVTLVNLKEHILDSIFLPNNLPLDWKSYVHRYKYDDELVRRMRGYTYETGGERGTILRDIDIPKGGWKEIPLTAIEPELESHLNDKFHSSNKWYTKKSGGIFADTSENVLWFSPNTLHAANGMYVTWGWFEDNILSRYTSYASKDGVGDLKLTVRSLDTRLDDKGVPIPNEPLPEGSPSESSLIAAGQVKNTGLAFASPEAIAMAQSEEAKLAGTGGRRELGDYIINNESLTENKKSLTEILNHPFLQSKDPLAFLLPGQNPSIQKFVVATGGNRKGYREFKSALNTLLQYTPTITVDGQKVERQFEVKGSNKTRGYLRNILINISEIQKAFGIPVNAERVFSTPIRSKNFWDGKGNQKVVHVSDINPPANIEAGIKNLLDRLNDNFFNIWDFHLVTDPYDTTNLKIIDVNLGSNNDTKYTDFNPTDGTLKTDGIYKFPSFKMGSTVKSQNLEFKIPNSMALTAMYGSNKTAKKVPYDPQHENSDLNAVFNNDISDIYNDDYLIDMEPTIRASNWGLDMNRIPTLNRIGSLASLPNSKITRDGGNLKINPNAPWGVALPVNEVSQEPIKNKTLKKNQVDPVYAFHDGDVIDTLNWKSDDNNIITMGKLWKGKLIEGVSYQKINPKIPNPPWYSIQPGGEIPVIQMENKVIIVIRDVIQGNIEKLSTRESLYKKDYIIPAELSLDIDGIEGLLPGDIIQTDYIQQKYNKTVKLDGIDYGPFTYFQIFGATHKINSSGWTTEISTKMRTNRFVLQRNADEVVNFLDDTADMVKTIDGTTATNQEVLENATNNENEAIINQAIEDNVEPTQEMITSVTPTIDEPVESETNLDASDVMDEEMIQIAEQNNFMSADNTRTNQSGMDLWYTSAAGTQTLDVTGPQGTNEIYNPNTFARELTNTFVSTESDNTTVSLDQMGFVTLPPSLTGQNSDTGNLTVAEGQGPDGQSIKSDADGNMYYDDYEKALTKADLMAQAGLALPPTLKVDKDGDVKQIETHHDSKTEAVLKNNLLELSGNSEVAQSAIGDPGPIPEPGDEEFIGPLMVPDIIVGIMSPEVVKKKDEAAVDGENLQILADEVARKEEAARLAAEAKEKADFENFIRDIDELLSKMAKLTGIYNVGPKRSFTISSSAEIAMKKYSLRRTLDIELKRDIRERAGLTGIPADADGNSFWHSPSKHIVFIDTSQPNTEPAYAIQVLLTFSDFQLESSNYPTKATQSVEYEIIDYRGVDDGWYSRYPFLRN